MEARTSVSAITCVLNDSFYNHSLFPVIYAVSRADRGYMDFNLTRADVRLVAVHHSISFYMRRYDLVLNNECVWTEIPVNDGFSLLVGSNYFPPKSDTKFIENKF
jgi:hypothetical protein